jgi:hypothetical protein
MAEGRTRHEECSGTAAHLDGVRQMRRHPHALEGTTEPSATQYIRANTEGEGVADQEGCLSQGGW